MNKSEKLSAALIHLSWMTFPIAAPLFAYMITKNDKALGPQCAQALIYQLMSVPVLLILAAFAMVTLGVGLILSVPLAIIWGLFSVYAAYKALKGEKYIYPVVGEIIQ